MEGGDLAATGCAICYDEFQRGGDVIRARMPCCERRESTIGFCVACLQVVCERSPGKVGQCPTCRTFITVGPSGEVRKAENFGKCAICCQNRVLTERTRCSACALGARLYLLYECQQCGRSQRIPHPMWTYQETPSDFSTVTWACHRGCGTYTRWRVLPNFLSAIPAEHSPESWGRREEWLAQIRAARYQQRRKVSCHRFLLYFVIVASVMWYTLNYSES